MKSIRTFYYSLLTQPETVTIMRWLLAIFLIVWAGHAFADDQGDILAGTDAALGKTIGGTGKKFIYAAEGILSLAMYIKTKNLLVLGGIVVVAVFFNIILKVSGLTA
jgi:hypothetical protein